MSETNSNYSIFSNFLNSNRCGSKTLKRGEHLCKEGDYDNCLYIIRSGTIRAYKYIDDEEVTVRFGYSGDVIVAIDSFLTEQRTSLNLQAIKKAEVEYIQKYKFLAFFTKDLESLKAWNEILSELILQQLEREIDLLIESPLGRYNRVLSRSPKLFQEIPAKYIASYLRMTPETLSRLGKI